MRGLIKEVGDYFELSFSYSPSIIEKVKEIPGRRWDSQKRLWLVPKAAKAALEEFAKKNQFKFHVDQPDPAVNYIIPAMPELTISIPLKKELFPFQKQGVAYCLRKKKTIIGDQPGLGKTAQAIATIVAAKSFPCLVICPASLKLNWQREIEMWSYHKAMILADSNKDSFRFFYEAGMANFFIVNYESLAKYFVKSIARKADGSFTLKDVTFNGNETFFSSVIIDESHRVKSIKAQQSKFTKRISENKEYVLAITGTPVVNRPNDLVSQLSIIGQLFRFGGYVKFIDRYCSNDSNRYRKELNYLLNLNCFYRREKHEVLKELPEKIRQKYICSIDNVNEYAAALNDLELYLKRYKGATEEQVERSMRGEVMVRIGVLKNISARGKLNNAFSFIDDVIESGEKIIVFGHLKDVLKRVKEKYGKQAVSITGDDDTPSRQHAVDLFQKNPDIMICVCSIQAAGVGLTLTAANHVAFIEMGWHPAIMDQCEDRAHRIGQLDNVTCTYFLGDGTIDEDIYNLIEEKRAMSSEITGSTEDIMWQVVEKLGLFSDVNQNPKSYAS